MVMGLRHFSTGILPADGIGKRSARVAHRQGRSFWLERLHSLSGIVPIGAFLLVHFYENGTVLQGAAAFDTTAKDVRSISFLPFFEIFFILLPILYHMVYGLALTTITRPNNVRYSYRRNAFFTIQRVSGVILVLFILYHLITLRFGLFLNGPPTYAAMVSTLANPIVLIWYLIGVTTATLHLSSGAWSFLVRWGITIGAQSQHAAAYVCAVFFVLLTAAGWAISFAFFFGARQVLALHGLP
jgi:succinate dehydrogenase / fumarate reductase cytochrome b subunit